MFIRTLLYLNTKPSSTFANRLHSAIKLSVRSSVICPAKAQMGVKLKYPEVRRDENVVDIYHGTKVRDPYRWLEDPDSEETKAFVNAQNHITTQYIDACPFKDVISKKIRELWDYPKYSCPTKHGEKYYFFKNSGLQNQSVIYVQDTLESEPKVFLDPNLLSEDGTLAILRYEFSDDGSIFAYALSQSGSDWSNINFINTKTGEKYPEVLRKVKYSSIAWTHDNQGIFYACFSHVDNAADGSETDQVKDQKLMYHKIGTLQDKDILITDFPENPLWRIYSTVSDCGNWLILLPQLECSNNLVYFTKIPAEITGRLPFIPIIEKMEADYEYIGNSGTKAIFKTNKNAPNSKVISIDLENYQEKNWNTLIPEHNHNALEWASVVDGNKLILCYVEDVKNTLAVHSLESGEFIRSIPLEVGTIADFSGDKKYSEIFYQIKSFLYPGMIYRLDFKSQNQSSQVYREIKVKGFNPHDFETTQIFYESKDGTKVPMYIIHKVDATLDGSLPALLYGYGGFNINLLPTFSITRIIFMQCFNGVLAIPNIRGGGEYGDKWHKSAVNLKKQNSFDDFISAAEYLIKNKYTSKEKLVIQGGSNGGFLVAACANQRPDLFKAVLAAAGVLDLLRYHKFTVAYSWKSDYGSSENPEEFENLLKLSPLHNIRVPEEGQYPAIFVLTADHDDRVSPLHSLKYIATLQNTLGNNPNQTNPLLARIELKAGHGEGKPTSKRIEEQTDLFTFILQVLNLTFTP